MLYTWASSLSERLCCPPLPLILAHPTPLHPLLFFNTRFIRSAGCRYHPVVEVSHVYSGSFNSCRLVLRREVGLVQNPVKFPFHGRVRTSKKVSPPPIAFRRLTKFALCYGLNCTSALSGLCHRASPKIPSGAPVRLRGELAITPAGTFQPAGKVVFLMAQTSFRFSLTSFVSCFSLLFPEHFMALPTFRRSEHSII